MRPFITVVAWAILLTVITAGLGWFGIRGWDGEKGGNLLAIFGMPLWVTLFTLQALHVHPIAMWILGGVAQFIFCLIVVGLLRGMMASIWPAKNKD